LQSQQDIEARIDEILSKIAVLQSAQQTASAISPAANSVETDAAKYQKKLDELEAQLSGLTRDRLDYLEKLHQQQLDIQVFWCSHFPFHSSLCWIAFFEMHNYCRFDVVMISSKL